MSVSDPIYVCPVATWLQTALPANAPRPPDSYVHSLIKDLYGEKDCPTLDDNQGLAPISRLPQPNDTSPNKLSNDLLVKAIDTIAGDVLQWLHEHKAHEHGRRAPVHIDSPLFHHITYQQEEPFPYVSDARMVTALTLDENDDEWSMYQAIKGAGEIMFKDPRRRYLYGLTISGRSTTLWKFDRCSILISDPFNCQEWPNLLIRMLIFLCLAEREDLGFDPTVHAITSCDDRDPANSLPHNRLSWVYQLGGRRYRTVGQPLHESSRSALCSSGVRVWTVKEVDENNSSVLHAPEHVLKDCWTEFGYTNDRECQATIRKRLRTLDNDGIARTQEMDAFFMNIRHDDEITVHGTADVTLIIPESASWFFFSREFYREHDSTNYYSYSDHYYLHQKFRSDSPKPPPRFHRRLLFEDKCMRLTDCNDLIVVLDCFKQLCTALDLFRQAEYVHRDISIGNCLVFEKNGFYQAKISDMEYCKDYSSISSVDPVKGTPEFMAIGVAPRAIAWYEGHSVPATFHYHPLHDLESLYWVLIWLILSQEPHTCDLSPDTDTYSSWDRLFRGLFPRARHPADINIQAGKLVLFSPLKYRPWYPVMDLLGWPVDQVFKPIFSLMREWESTYINLTKMPQDPDTQRWPISYITDEMYKKFQETLEKDILAIPHPFLIRSIPQKLQDAESLARAFPREEFLSISN